MASVGIVEKTWKNGVTIFLLLIEYELFTIQQKKHIAGK